MKRPTHSVYIDENPCRFLSLCSTHSGAVAAFNNAYPNKDEFTNRVLREKRGWSEVAIAEIEKEAALFGVHAGALLFSTWMYWLERCSPPYEYLLDAFLCVQEDVFEEDV